MVYKRKMKKYQEMPEPEVVDVSERVDIVTVVSASKLLTYSARVVASNFDIDVNAVKYLKIGGKVVLRKDLALELENELLVTIIKED